MKDDFDDLVPKYTNDHKMTYERDIHKDQVARLSQIGGDHYKTMKIQPYEYIVANNLGFLEGNVIKYVSRHAQKNGRIDLEKAIHCLELLLEAKYGSSI